METSLPELRLTACTVDLAGRRVVRHDGGAHPLTPRERDLLVYLAARPSETIGRDELLREVWGYERPVVTRAVDQTVIRLRRKIEEQPDNPRHLLTIFGTGYRLELGVSRPTLPARDAAQSVPGLRLGDQRIDLAQRVIAGPGSTASLTQTEADLLRWLAARRGRVVSRGELLRHVWGNQSEASPRAVDATIKRLRQKIEADPAKPAFIKTIRGKGYRLDGAGPSPPVGTVVLLVAEVTDSAALWRASSDAMAAAVAVRDAALEELVAAHGGYLIEAGARRIAVAFGDATVATRWATEAQLALLRAPWPEALLQQPGADVVRSPDGSSLYRGPRLAMAVHEGPAVTRTSPAGGRLQYLGTTVDHAEAILALVGGGQVVMSRRTWARVAASLRDAVASRGLGEQALPGELLDRSLVSVAPPALAGRLLAGRRVANLGALPSVVSALVGRGGDLAHLRSVLRDAPGIVSLVGPPGVGKTRVAREVAGEWEAGAWWADLSAASTGPQVLACIAVALGLELATSDPVAQVGRALNYRPRALLVVDAAEHLPPVAARALRTLSDHTPQTRLLVTSQRRLGLDGERVVQLGSLEPGDAVALFVARSRGEVGPEEPVAEVVRRLDYLPLAIELAAARTDVLPTWALLARLDDRFAVLTGHYGAQATHTTLEAAIAWSWSLLDAHEQDAMCQLTVFRDGFTHDAAEAVLDPAEWPVDVATTLASLVDRCLVRAHGRDGRLAMYDSIAAYAVARGGPTPVTRRRHARSFAALGTEASLRAMHKSRRSLLALLDEAANLVAATEWSVDDPGADGAVAGAVAAASLAAVRTRGPAARGVELARGLRERVFPPRQQWLVQVGCAHALRTAGHLDEARACLEAARGVARSLADPALEALATLHLGHLHRLGGDWAAAGEDYARAVDLDAEQRGAVELALGLRDLFAGDVSRAAVRMRVAVDLARERSELGNLSLGLAHLAEIEHTAGGLDAARACNEESVRVARELGNAAALAHRLSNLGHFYASTGHEDLGRVYLEEAVAVAGEAGNATARAVALGNLAVLEAATGAAQVARQMFGEAIALASEVRNAWLQGVLGAELARVLVEAEDFQAGWDAAERARALLRSVGEDRHRAVALCWAGYAALGLGNPGAARERHADAVALVARVGAVPGHDLVAVLAELHTALAGA